MKSGSFRTSTAAQAARMWFKKLKEALDIVLVARGSDGEDYGVDNKQAELSASLTDLSPSPEHIEGDGGIREADR